MANKTCLSKRSETQLSITHSFCQTPATGSCGDIIVSGVVQKDSTENKETIHV